MIAFLPMMNLTRSMHFINNNFVASLAVITSRFCVSLHREHIILHFPLEKRLSAGILSLLSVICVNVLFLGRMVPFFHLLYRRMHKLYEDSMKGYALLWTKMIIDRQQVNIYIIKVMLFRGLESFCGLCLCTWGIADLVAAICPSIIDKENDGRYCSLPFLPTSDKQDMFIVLLRLVSLSFS